MSVRVLLDGDAVSKLARWDLLDAALEALGVTRSECATLDTVRYRFRLNDPAQAAQRCGSLAAAERLKTFVVTLGTPPAPSSDTVLALAGAPDIDVGEAVLLGQLAVLPNALLITGDKQCLRAMADARNKAIATQVSGRLLCLEQLVSIMIRRLGIARVRQGIAKDLGADITIRNVFGSQGDASDDSVSEGLASYLGEIRGTTGGLLADEMPLGVSGLK